MWQCSETECSWMWQCSETECSWMWQCSETECSWMWQCSQTRGCIAAVATVAVTACRRLSRCCSCTAAPAACWWCDASGLVLLIIWCCTFKRTYASIVLPVVLCGCETWCLALMKERRVMVYENRVRGDRGVEKTT